MMDVQILKLVGQVAGIGGLAIGLALLIFREIVRKKIFPNLTKSHAFKIITLIIICTWSIAIVGIGAWAYTETYAPEKKENIQVSSVQSYLKEYGDSTVSIIDLNIKNKGSFSENIAKIRFNVIEVFRYNYDPCPTCGRRFAEGVYNISFKKVVDGANEYLVPHVIEPNSIERINLVLGGDFSDRGSYLARITLSIFTGSGEIIETNPVDVLVQNLDQGDLVALNKVGDTKLKEFVDSGTTAPEVISSSVIKKYFRNGGRDRRPLLPDWFKS